MHMYIDTFGDRGDNTKAHEADPVSAEYDQRKLYVSLNSSSKAINFLWLLKKVIDKLQDVPTSFTHLHLSTPWLPTWFLSQGTRQRAYAVEDNPHCHY